MKNYLLSLALVVGVSGTANAADQKGKVKKKDVIEQNDFQTYGSVSLGLSQFSVAEGSATATSDMTTDAQGRVGVKFAKYFGVEGEYAIGLSDWDLGDGVTLGLDNALAGYAVARYPFGNGKDSGDVFVRLGYHSTTLEAGVDNASADIKDEGFAFGLGGTYFFTPNFGVRGDITSYHLDDDILGDIGSLTYIGGGLGAVVRF